MLSFLEISNGDFGGLVWFVLTAENCYVMLDKMISGSDSVYL